MKRFSVIKSLFTFAIAWVDFLSCFHHHSNKSATTLLSCHKTIAQSIVSYNFFLWMLETREGGGWKWFRYKLKQKLFLWCNDRTNVMIHLDICLSWCVCVYVWPQTKRQKKTLFHTTCVCDLICHYFIIDINNIRPKIESWKSIDFVIRFFRRNQNSK